MPASGVGRKAGGKQGVVGVKITHHNAGVSGCESKNEGQIEDSSRRPVDVIYDQWKAGEMKGDGKNINPITARDWRGDTGEVEMLLKGPHTCSGGPSGGLNRRPDRPPDVAHTLFCPASRPRSVLV